MSILTVILFSFQKINTLVCLISQALFLKIKCIFAANSDRMKLQTANDVEIMAPVGSYESLMAAIQGGANSIYFGIGKLNMRSKSSKNFSLADLAKIASICKEHSIRSYITLNTVIYDKEIEEMRLGRKQLQTIQSLSFHHRLKSYH